MTDLFDFTPRALRFAVMGNPVAHSRSPHIHRLFAQQFDITLEYDPIQVDAGGFDQAVSHFAARGGVGLNITVPFKGEAWRWCGAPGGRVSERAERAAAVNTMHFDRDGAVFGDNTDGAGLVRDLEGNLGVALDGRRVLLLGAGGAVRGVAHPLAARRPAAITIANRTTHKARDLAAQCALSEGEVIGCGYERVREPYDVIINGTAAGLHGELPPLSPRCVAPHTVIYDMMYADAPTVFMRWGLARGAAHAHDGLGMLVEQAAESFHLWHDKHPDTAAVIRTLRKY